ncbi:unnamed protein product [Periconia digitata]|uniref:Uncharacterized protein n=1 Tax=Periconia digitata TaxID=1303443 RepID=A0A9W4UNC9_9PLEO|nr:unnamed protein product [Periconia digitata]
MDHPTPPAENQSLESTYEGEEPEAVPEISWNISNPSRSSKVSAETRARWELLRALAGVQRPESEANSVKDDSSNAGSKRNSLALSDRTHSSNAVSPSGEHQHFDRHEIEKHTRDAANKRLSQHNRGLRPLFLPQMVEKERKQHGGDVTEVGQENTSSQISGAGDVSGEAQDSQETTIPDVAQGATEASDNINPSTTPLEDYDPPKANALDSSAAASDPTPADPVPLESEISQDVVSLPPQENLPEPSTPSSSQVATAESTQETGLEDSVAVDLQAESIPLPASPLTTLEDQDDSLVVENEDNSKNPAADEAGESDLIEEKPSNMSEIGVLDDASEVKTLHENQLATSENAVLASTEESEDVGDAALSNHNPEIEVSSEAAKETQDQITDGSDAVISSNVEDSQDTQNDASIAPEDDAPMITEESEGVEVEIPSTSSDVVSDDANDEKNERDKDQSAAVPPAPSVPEPVVIPVNQRKPEEILALLALGDPATLEYIKTEEGVAWLLNMFLHGSVALAKLWAENNLLSVEMREILLRGHT